MPAANAPMPPPSFRAARQREQAGTSQNQGLFTASDHSVMRAGGITSISKVRACILARAGFIWSDDYQSERSGRPPERPRFNESFLKNFQLQKQHIWRFWSTGRISLSRLALRHDPLHNPSVDAVGSKSEDVIERPAAFASSE